LFRLATLTWSVPVSEGYGRRMRFLVWDDSIGRLMGVIALCDPVFNRNVRDSAIGWGVEDRKDRLVNVMDAYVLGALPPYNSLLCGKLVACLVRTEEVRDCFARYRSPSCGRNCVGNARGPAPYTSVRRAIPSNRFPRSWTWLMTCSSFFWSRRSAWPSAPRGGFPSATAICWPPMHLWSRGGSG
jgi:hypothetical protein